MDAYRYLLGTTLLDVILTPAEDGAFVATAYVVIQGSLARRPVLDGAQVLSARAADERAALDAVLRRLEARFGAPRQTPWSGQKVQQPEFLRIVS